METAIFDLQEALERVDGDGRFLVELVDMCLQDLADRLDSMRSAARQNDLRTLRELAHTSKSGLGNVGASQAAHLAKEIEVAARSEASTDYPALVQSLADAISAFEATFATHRGQLTS